ncbi:MAG: hypothetical protein C0404_07090 [Verrucomicrobia bacterium]|nr:hypothetical protein [Verrucomicrobiota bacterium]
MKSILAVILLLSFELCADGQSPGEFPHTPPPLGDPYLTNRFGISWGQPISNGFLIADGKYIDGPYVVEQRGYVIFVNNVKWDNGCDVRLVLPEPEPPAVTEDPGMPTDVTKDTSIQSLPLHPTTEAKRKYWTHQKLDGVAIEKELIKYYSSLPCVAKIENTQERGPGGKGVIFKVWDQKGGSMFISEALYPIPPRPPPPPDKDLLKQILQRQEEPASVLGSGALAICHNGGFVVQHERPEADDRWRRIFQTLSSTASEDEKLKSLVELGYISKGRPLDVVRGTYSLSHFQASPQLWKRLSGDATWKSDAEKNIHALTNDWKVLEPQFKRPVVAVGKSTTPAPPARTLSTGAPELSAKPEKMPTPEETPPQELETKQTSPAWLFIVGGVAVLLVVLFVMRRK